MRRSPRFRQEEAGRDAFLLRDTIRRTWPSGVRAFGDTKTAIEEGEEMLAELRNECRKDRLADWRYKMKQKGKFCTRWLKEILLPGPLLR